MNRSASRQALAWSAAAILIGSAADAASLNVPPGFETSRVFAEGLVPSMGLVWHEGKIYAANPPDLVTLEDTDCDGLVDKRTILLAGFGHTDNGSLHGLVFGPKGWLYLTMGEPDGYHLKRPDGSVSEGKSGALLRCRPDGSGGHGRNPICGPGHCLPTPGVNEQCQAHGGRTNNLNEPDENTRFPT